MKVDFVKNIDETNIGISSTISATGIMKVLGVRQRFGREWKLTFLCPVSFRTTLI
jgi:hypothetical protein